MRSELLEILKQEVKPALGCTGPTSVSFAVSAARDAVGGKATSVQVFVDRDTYKNSVSVGIPGTSKKGLRIAAALGALCGDSAAGLEVLKNVTPEDEANAEIFMQTAVNLEIKWDLEDVGLYIEAIANTNQGVGRVIVAKTHTNIVLAEVNGKVLTQSHFDDYHEVIDHSHDPIRKFNVEDFYCFARDINIEKIQFLQTALDMNYKLTQLGLEDGVGIGYGRAFNNLPGNSVINQAKAFAAAASDARMAGRDLPAMSCASSGNVGIAASLPLLAVAQGCNKNGEELLRAVCLSFLLTIYIKSHIGRLSAMCACAIAASIGVTAGTAMLLGGDVDDVRNSIGNVAGNIGGVICDGAKSGCALKLAFASNVAIESAYLALKKVAIPINEGIVSATAEKTLAFLGIIASKGMIKTDQTVCESIIGREKNM